MSVRKILLLLTIVLLVVTSEYTYILADLDPAIRGELHDIAALLINKNNTDAIWSLRDSAEQIEVVVLSVSYGNLSTSQLSIIKDWVARGGGLYLAREPVSKTGSRSQDLENYSRQAGELKTFNRLYKRPLTLDETRSKEFWNPGELLIKAFFGEVKIVHTSLDYVQSAQVLLLKSTGGHPITTEVKRLGAISNVRDGLGAKAFERGPDQTFTPILENVIGKVVFAVRTVGRGRVAFNGCSGGLEEVLDIDRFTVNLFEWLAGYPVP